MVFLTVFFANLGKLNQPHSIFYCLVTWYCCMWWWISIQCKNFRWPSCTAKCSSSFLDINLLFFLCKYAELNFVWMELTSACSAFFCSLPVHTNSHTCTHTYIHENTQPQQVRDCWSRPQCCPICILNACSQPTTVFTVQRSTANLHT